MRIPTLVVTVLAALAAACAPPRVPPATDAETAGGALLVRVTVPDDRASVAIALFDAAGWRADEPLATARVTPVDGVAGWRVEPLAPGRYAVKAYRDLDGDGSLGRGAFGRPTEPYGFSRGARAPFGPPSFDAAAFVLRPGATVDVELD